MGRPEIRELHYFIAVAEELHFGRAAERLGMAQPPLSRAISGLESRMGVRLFERSSRRVELTDAGEVFLNECRRLLRNLDVAVRRTQRAARRKPLAIAVRPGFCTALLSSVLHSQEASQTELVFSNRPGESLREGKADVAMLCSVNDEYDDLETTEISKELPIALVPSGHAFARLSTVTHAELLQDHRFKEEGPLIPRDEILVRVALGRLITIVGADAAENMGEGVTAVHVTDMPMSTVVLGWLPGSPRADIAPFARALRRIATASESAEATDGSAA